MDYRTCVLLGNHDPIVISLTGKFKSVSFEGVTYTLVSGGSGKIFFADAELPSSTVADKLLNYLSSTRAPTLNTFGEALAALKSGRKVKLPYMAENVFLYLVPGSEFKVSRAPLNVIYEEGKEIKYLPHIDIAYADGTCGVWCPNMADILSDYWILL